MKEADNLTDVEDKGRDPEIHMKEVEGPTEV